MGQKYVVIVSQTTKWLIDFHMVNIHSKPLFSYPDCEVLEDRNCFSYFLVLEVEELSEQNGQLGRDLVAGAQSLQGQGRK